MYKRGYFCQISQSDYLSSHLIVHLVHPRERGEAPAPPPSRRRSPSPGPRTEALVHTFSQVACWCAGLSGVAVCWFICFLLVYLVRRSGVFGVAVCWCIWCAGVLVPLPPPDVLPLLPELPARFPGRHQGHQGGRHPRQGSLARPGGLQVILASTTPYIAPSTTPTLSRSSLVLGSPLQRPVARVAPGEALPAVPSVPSIVHTNSSIFY